MKIAVTGKGGVGKTTVSALLAGAFVQRGREVFAIDADPDANLAGTLGIPDADRIRPLVELKELIAERTGVEPGTIGGMFRLNPLVSDIPDTYAVEVEGIRVLVAGAVKKGGAGCYCPENAMVRALVSHLLVERDAALVLDMEAGVEHLGRGTVEAVDSLLMVVEPGRRSIETAARIRTLASDLGLARVEAIVNKVRSESEKAFVRKALAGIEIAGHVPYDEAIRDAEIQGDSVVGASPAVDRTVLEIVKHLEENNRQ